MPAVKPEPQSAEDAKAKPPAKGGTEPANRAAQPSGDSPKPHGDPLKHVIAEKEKEKET